MQDKDQRRKAESLWAANKYLVLSKSQAYYLEIREYLKRDQVDVSHVQNIIDKALALGDSKKDMINAYLHIWGYFKNKAGEEEKNKFLVLLNDYKNDLIPKERILDFLKKLLDRYPCDYLKNSTIFKENP